MTVLVALLVGFFTGRVVWLALRSTWSEGPLLRTNYQGTSLPTAAGVTIAVSLLVVEGLFAAFDALGISEAVGMSPARAGVLIAVLGFSLLGLVDDLVGTNNEKGLAGHIKALGRGQLTTGGLKLIAGIAIAGIAASFVSNETGLGFFVDAAIIALAANLMNLFDLRPGRASKMGILIFVVMALASALDAQLLPVAIVVGAAAALTLDDLHERLMIGDTGANALGAGLGLGLVAITGGAGQIAVLVVLLGLTLLSEFVSFTKLFETVGFLKSFDRLGRRGPAAVDLRESASKKNTARNDDDFDDDEDDRRSTRSAARTTVGSAHVGAPAGSQSSREQSPFPSSDSTERAATRRSELRDDTAEHNIAPNDHRGSSSRSFMDDRGNDRRNNSPFGDDEF